MFELIQLGNLRLYADDPLRSHAAHAVAVKSSRRWKLCKQRAANKLDGIVGLAMASLLAMQEQAQLFEVLAVC